MSESLAETYTALTERIVAQTLKGNIRSKAQVRNMLNEAVEPGTGEIFERVLAARIAEVETQLEGSLKAPRILRALKTMESEWQQGMADRQVARAVAAAAEKLSQAEASQRPVEFLSLIDPNQPNSLNRKQLAELAKALQSSDEMSAWAQGIQLGLENYGRLEPDLVSWLYTDGRATVGFGERERGGPWPLWQKASTGLPKLLFTVLAQAEEIESLTRTAVDISSWVNLAVLLHFVQRGLITWFDKQPYSAKAGKQLSYSTSLIFAAIWGRLSQGFGASGAGSYAALADGSFQMMLQILRT
ncbi:MAG: hypothetical protein AAFP07_17755, partial [Cyanobacteria bacterium J06606_4]